jgi:hypothetical protein
MSRIIHFNQMDVEVEQIRSDKWIVTEVADFSYPIGCGSTMMEAIVDLREQLEESE